MRKKLSVEKAPSSNTPAKRPNPEDLLAIFAKSGNIRLAILKAISKSTHGKMRFKDILNNVHSVSDYDSLSPQNLVYHLNTLRHGQLIDQASDGDYTITYLGHFMLQVYEQIEYELSSDKTREKPAFVGEGLGSISYSGFDYKRLGEELSKLPFFLKGLSIENQVSLRWRENDENFESEIVIDERGFCIRTIIYRERAQVEESFMEDLKKNEEWYEMVKGFTQTIFYYIKKSVLQLWRGAEVSLDYIDAYPINLYAGVEANEERTTS